MQIIITSTSQRLKIPWLPDEISLSSGSTRVQSYEIIDLGEVEIPSGSNLESVSWSSVLPGKIHSTLPFLKYDSQDVWKDPSEIVEMMRGWRKNGTLLVLSVFDEQNGKSVSYINHDVYIADYEAVLSGGNGDVEYTVTFKEARKLKMSTATASSSSSSSKTTSKKKTIPKTYKIQKGDTLYKISVKFWGNGKHKKTLWKLNKKKLNKVARKHGRKSSKKGKYLYKGTVIKLKKK